MRMKLIAAALTGLVSLAAAVPASAQVGHREYRQEQRIRQGERSGALTQREAWRLQHRQERFHDREADMRRHDGGRLSPHDRWVLRHRQNVMSRHIHRHKHDWRQRG